jgi:hypothetical protein
MKREYQTALEKRIAYKKEIEPPYKKRRKIEKSEMSYKKKVLGILQ